MRCTHGLRVGRPLEETSTDSGTASRVGFARIITEDTGTYWTCLPMFSLLSLCVGLFRPTSRRRVRDQVYNVCLRDLLVRSGSCHLVRHLYMVVLWRIVMHAHQDG